MKVRTLYTAAAALALTGAAFAQQSGLPAPSLANTPTGCSISGQVPTAVDQFGNAIACIMPAGYGENDITFSATPVFSANATVNYLQLTGNVTSSTLPAGTPGKHIGVVICQDAVGLRAFTWPSNVRGGIAVATLPNKCSATVLIYVSALTSWVALGPGIVSF